MDNSIMLGGLIVAVALGVAFIAWKLWDSNQADQQYAHDKQSADAVVRDALQGHSFTVGEPADFTEGQLHGHFSWLGARGAWGLRLTHPKSSMRHLNGMPFPLCVRHRDGETWARHTGEALPLTAYNTDLSIVLPQGLHEGDQIRLGTDALERAAR